MSYNLRSRLSADSIEEDSNARHASNVNGNVEQDDRIFYVTRRISKLNSTCALSGIYIPVEYQTQCMKKCYHSELLSDWFHYCKSFVLPCGQALDEDAENDMRACLDNTESYEPKTIDDTVCTEFIHEIRESLMNSILSSEYNAKKTDYFKCILLWSYTRDAKDCMQYILKVLLSCELISGLYENPLYKVSCEALRDLCLHALECIYTCPTNYEIVQKVSEWKSLHSFQSFNIYLNRLSHRLSDIMDGLEE